VLRITDVQADRFSLYIHEAPDKDGPHTTETVSYVVLEAGTWQVAGGVQLKAGTLVTTATVGLRINNIWAPVTFSETFSSAPVVLSQVQSNDDPHWVKTRQHNVGAGGFDVALEEEEASATSPEGDLRSHGSETIGWLALDAGHEDVEQPPLSHSAPKGCALDRSLHCPAALPMVAGGTLFRRRLSRPQRR
jgi:serine protease AprX